LEVVGALELDGERLPAVEAGEEGRIRRLDGFSEAQGRAAGGRKGGDEEAGPKGEIARDGMRRRAALFRRDSFQG
jgi:hypothetical protein